ncbi:MAG: hypothetical protein JWM34_3033 [Ilumatobacteraceae bacterium]|nr:hypothetical protein [Ilumatobacteraceae bacterium]
MTTRVVHLRHLARRFRGALSSAPPPAADDAWAVGLLTPGEAALWWRMQAQDRRHSIEVARRLADILDEPGRAAMAAALLHDVGKIESRLSTAERVVATVVGPRTARFASYHDHERLGVELLTAAGSAAETVSLIDGSSADHVLLAALRRADDI